MHIAIRNHLDDEQSRILMAACDLAWRRIIQADVLTSMQQPYAQSIVCAHLLRLVRRGERNKARLASRGVFLIVEFWPVRTTNTFQDAPLRQSPKCISG